MKIGFYSQHSADQLVLDETPVEYLRVGDTVISLLTHFKNGYGVTAYFKLCIVKICTVFLFHGKIITQLHPSTVHTVVRLYNNITSIFKKKGKIPERTSPACVQIRPGKNTRVSGYPPGDIGIRV